MLPSVFDPRKMIPGRHCQQTTHCKGEGTGMGPEVSDFFPRLTQEGNPAFLKQLISRFKTQLNLE